MSRAFASVHLPEGRKCAYAGCKRNCMKNCRRELALFDDVGILLLLALARILLQVLTNGQYGFFRDELVILDDARHLAWGYVAYPPLVPFLGRLGLDLFGPSMNGIRLFAVIAQGAVMLLAGLMVRAMGGNRWAQILAAVAVGTSPASVVNGTMLQYTTFDYVWWVLAAYFVIRLTQSDDPRWWVGIGFAVGIGLLTKYTIVFLVVGIALGTLCTKNRRHLRSPWLWGGLALALLIALPNLIWQVQNGFVSFTFLQSIHSRDVHLGRARGFFLDQLKFNGNLITIVLIIAGLYWCFLSPRGRRFQIIGWMYVTTLSLFLVSRGRPYYLSPTYPVLIAAGAVWAEQRLSGLSRRTRRILSATGYVVLAAGAVWVVALTLPVAPVNTPWWRIISSLNENLKEEIGWTDLVKTVAGVYSGLPEPEKPQTGILAQNGGEAGAVNLYGMAYGLPTAISGFNASWERGYGDPPPKTVIAVGFSPDFLRANFESCEAAAIITNPYNIRNQETTNCPVIYLCRNLRSSWPELWRKVRCFG